MKIAYISTPWFADVDLSYLSSLQDKCEIDYYLILLPGWTKVTAININQFYHATGIFNASIYPELQTFSDMINLDRTYVVNIDSTSYHSIPNFKVFYQLYKRLKKEKYDVIHHTTIPDYNRLILYLFRKKTLFSFHDPIPHSSNHSLTFILNRWICTKFGINYLLYNDVQKGDFINLYKLDNRKTNIFTSSLGVYTYLKYFNTERCVDGKYILFFGGISSYKGLEYLFPAMVEVHKHYPDIKLVVAGKGNFYFDITPYKKLPYFIFINKFVEDRFLSALIRDSIFVTAPYKDATQSGVVMSAFAHCKPCVVTNVGGLPEMVEHNKMGIVVPPCDVNSLSEGLLSLLSNESILDTFSNNIKNSYFLGNKSWELISDGMLRIYESIKDDKH